MESERIYYNHPNPRNLYENNILGLEERIRESNYLLRRDIENDSYTSEEKRDYSEGNLGD